MAIFYGNDEKGNRPHVYMRYSTRDKSMKLASSAEQPYVPEQGENQILADKNGTILKTADGKYLAVKL